MKQYWNAIKEGWSAFKKSYDAYLKNYQLQENVARRLNGEVDEKENGLLSFYSGQKNYYSIPTKPLPKEDEDATVRILNGTKFDRGNVAPPHDPKDIEGILNQVSPDHHPNPPQPKT